MKKYIAIKLFVPEENQDMFIGLISDFEITGVEQNNDELTVNFPANVYNDNTENELSEIVRNSNLNAKIIDKTIIEEKNWNEEWEKNLEPVFVNERLVITPKSKASSYLDYEYMIKIDPQMSFGTGYHATTRLASKLLLESVSNDERWVDAGTGTGILAILASKLGAKDVLAFDIDEWSVKNSIENVGINDVNNIEVVLGDLNTIELKEYDGIVANIFANILIDNMYKFSNALKSNGILICTGILKYDKNKVLTSAIDKGFELIEELAEDEWIAYKLEKVR